MKIVTNLVTVLNLKSLLKVINTNKRLFFVPQAGIEPARRKALDFESNVSTNSTTEALNNWSGKSNTLKLFLNTNWLLFREPSLK